MAKPLHCARVPVLATLCGTSMVLARAPSIARVTAYKHYTTNSSATVQPDDNPPAAEASRYFGHRTHKKICSSCGLPNLLPVSRCVACGEAVGDGNIRPVGQHDPLLEAVMVAKPTPKLLQEKGQASRHHRPQKLSRLFTGAKPSRVWHADFDTLVMDCPWPSSTSGHHVLGITKSSRSYDIRCLNRGHLQQLDNLHAQCVEALHQSLVADKGKPTSLAVELLKQTQFGFRLFAPPYWMTFRAVREALGKHGRITDVSSCLPSSAVVGSIPRGITEAHNVGVRLMKGFTSPPGQG
ncbi:hypothetical protein FOZ61_009656 [Perkinsus olseni]|uniref:Uncharacterized protein n=1 Tax=Perkinsus olseni TaxID=32597 RepID=A0A7J6M612_PEROL|nr:hypothetical protein FOZ61_009656 [Perkinsus olseni]